MFHILTDGEGLSQMQKIEIQTAAGSRRSYDAVLRGGGTCVYLARYLETPDGALFAFPRRLGEESRALCGADGDIRVANKVVICCEKRLEAPPRPLFD